MPSPTLRNTVPVAVLVALLLAGAGCAATPPAPEVRAERQAALVRWSRCVERQSAGLATRQGAVLVRTGGARPRLVPGCDGYRRDVVVAFPAHLERPLEKALDERAERRLRTRLSAAGDAEADAATGADAFERLVQRLVDAFSPG